MIKHFIIDGNNLLGKLNKFSQFKKSDNIDSRVKLAYLLDRFFHNHKVEVTLHFDGFKKDAIKTNNLRITYSDNRTADEWIKHDIMVAKNPRNICVVTSDNNLIEFARVNSCEIKKSEMFAEELYMKKNVDEEADKIKSIKDDEIKKLFGIK